MNAQRSTFNSQRSSGAAKFDLEDRLLDFAARVVAVTEKMKPTPAGQYVADQLLRSGLSPYGIHGEAEGAESRKDFIHKLKLCYKELRESRRWMKLVQKAMLISQPRLLDDLLTEADELVRIFAKSLQTASKNAEDDTLER